MTGNGRTSRTIVSVLVMLVVVAAVAPFAVFAVPQVVGADRSYVVLSGSMEPYMSPGDAVIVEQVPPRAIRKGDVITFGRESDVPTTHRVIERITDEQGVAFRTEGDANEDPDAGVVRPSEVLGEVRFVIPYIGHVVLFANTPVGMLSLVVIPVGLLVVSEAWAYADARRARRTVTTPRPAIRRVETEPTADGESSRAAEEAADGAPGASTTQPRPAPRQASTTSSAPAPAAGYGVKTLDLGLTFVVLVVLAAYSGWMLYDEVRVESAMVLAGAVMALLLVVATWVLAARGGSAEPPAEREVEPDGQPDQPDQTDRPGGVSAPLPRPGAEQAQETIDD